MMNNITDVYINYTTGIASHETIINATWGRIPVTSHDLTTMLPAHDMKSKDKWEHLLAFTDIVRTHLKELGLTSHPMIEKIKSIQDQQNFLGIFEIGHQPLLFGGGLFIAEKVALLDSLTRYLETKTAKNALPIFFIGGHDRLHNELITTRFPQYHSPKGLFLKFPTTTEEENVEPPIFRLRTPPRDWLDDALAKIEGNFNQLVKNSVEPHNRPLLLDRVQSVITLFRATWQQSKSYADWIEKTWRDLFLFHGNLNIALLPVTHSKFNEFLLPSYEWLLKETTRKTFINVFNETTMFLENEGFKPALPYREDHFVPFYLQCPHCDLHPRLQPRIIKEGIMEAFCKNCKKQENDGLINIPYNPRNPDLSEYRDWLLPRAESRTLILCYLLPETIHVGGGGETAYHAQLFPIYRKLGVIPPIFVKTHRLYFTTPWTEKITKNVSNLFQESFLPDKDLFKLTRKIRKSKDPTRIKELQLQLKQRIENNLERIRQLESSLEEKIKQDPSSANQIKEQLNILRLHASHFHGRFAPEQTKPDVSWNWSAMGILTGMHDLVHFIQRNTNTKLPVGSTVFLSPGTF